MNDKKSDRDRLVDMYILNRLSEAERVEFEEQMHINEELSQDVALMQSIVESLRQQDEMKQKMQAWKEIASTSQKVRSFKWVKVVSAIAACALLLIGVSYSCSYKALQDGDFDEYLLRGDLVMVIGYLENEQYSEALDFIDAEEQYRESCLSGSQTLSPNKAEYFKSELQYLQWARIQTLLRMREYDQAYEEVAAFRNNAGIYKAKAEGLYWRLKIRTLL